jgi:hypothetical protein
MASVQAGNYPSRAFLIAWISPVLNVAQLVAMLPKSLAACTGNSDVESSKSSARITRRVLSPRGMLTPHHPTPPHPTPPHPGVFGNLLGVLGYLMGVLGWAFSAI